VNGSGPLAGVKPNRRRGQRILLRFGQAEMVRIEDDREVGLAVVQAAQRRIAPRNRIGALQAVPVARRAA